MIYDLLSQIQISTGSRQYYVALLAALAFPDIAGAIDSDNGRATGEKYAKWFDEYVAGKLNSFNAQYLRGKDCYKYRCLMLHQGRVQDTTSRYSKTIFMVVDTNDIVAYCGVFVLDEGTTLCVDVEKFCEHIVEAGFDWLEKVEQTDRFIKNTAASASLFTLSFK